MRYHCATSAFRSPSPGCSETLAHLFGLVQTDPPQCVTTLASVPMCPVVCGKIGAHGRLAQLVARFLHTEEVISSSLVSPTTTPPFSVIALELVLVARAICSIVPSGRGNAEGRYPGGSSALGSREREVEQSAYLASRTYPASPCTIGSIPAISSSSVTRKPMVFSIAKPMMKATTNE